MRLEPTYWWRLLKYIQHFQFDAQALVRGLCDSEINELVSAIKRERDERAAKLKDNLNVGDRVEFLGKKGAVVCGFIEKVLAKNVLIAATDGGKWRVSPTLLKKAPWEGGVELSRVWLIKLNSVILLHAIKTIVRGEGYNWQFHSSNVIARFADNWWFHSSFAV